VLLVCLAGCAGTLPAGSDSDAVTDASEAELGFRPAGTCTDDVETAVGAEGRCTAAVDGATYGATVTVTAVDAEFEVQVDRG
jgi:hypothetical protein